MLDVGDRTSAQVSPPSCCTESPVVWHSAPRPKQAPKRPSGFGGGGRPGRKRRESDPTGMGMRWSNRRRGSPPGERRTRRGCAGVWIGCEKCSSTAHHVQDGRGSLDDGGGTGGSERRTSDPAKSLLASATKSSGHLQSMYDSLPWDISAVYETQNCDYKLRRGKCLGGKPRVVHPRNSCGESGQTEVRGRTRGVYSTAESSWGAAAMEHQGKECQGWRRYANHPMMINWVKASANVELRMQIIRRTHAHGCVTHATQLTASRSCASAINLLE